jgi:hypothetical protein
VTRRTGGWALVAALLAAGTVIGGCGEEPAPPAKKRLVSFVETYRDEEVFEVVVWKSIKLESRAFVLSATEQVEVLAADQTTDPETERPLQVFRVKHAKGEGWVEAHFVRR